MIQQEKTSENKTQAASTNINRGNTAVQLKDNRKPSVVQQKLAEKTTNQEASFAPIQRKNNTTGLPDNLKSGIENLSGHSMDDVKVHYNSSQPAQLNAHAYAQGTDIHIAAGQEKHLPHEAWHVVQQKQGRVKPTLQTKSKININDDKGLENEADSMGAKAMQTSNHTDVIQNVDAANKSPLIETPVANKVIQNMIGPDGHGKLVTAPAFKVYMAKKNTEGTYDMYDQSGTFFKQYGIKADDNRYNIYNPNEVEGSDDDEESSSYEESSTSGESSNSDDESSNSGESLSSGESSSSDDESSGSDDESLSSDDEKSDRKTASAVMSDPGEKERKRLRIIIKQGIFNAVGEGLNPRYIRSDKNKLIKLIGDTFGAKENKLGLLPDLFKGINAKILEEVIEELESEISGKMHTEEDKPKKIKNIDEYITIQREISGAIKEKFTSSTGNIELIHDGNYPPLIIHFPLLRKFIIDNQERASLKPKKKAKGKIRADQAKGMTKFLSARLMSLYNQNRGGTLPPLVEKSSFGFQIATLADMGDNLSIRLSPGINKDIELIIAKALTEIDKELQELMADEAEIEFDDKVVKTDALYKYWNKGRKSKDVSGDILMKSYNQKKTLLKHLVFTQVETGVKGVSTIGRILERNHNNIMILAANNMSLMKMAQIIFNKNTKAQLTANIGKTGLSSPNIDPLYKKHMTEKDEIGDELQRERLGLFEEILKSLKLEEAKINFDDDTVSDSEYEDEIPDDSKYGTNKTTIKTGKVVVPSGMASLSVLFTEDERIDLKAEKTKQTKKKKAKKLTPSDLKLIAAKIKQLEQQIAQKGKADKSGLKAMIPKDSSVYYEDHDVIKMMEDSGVPGYTAKDIIMLDINPNITQSPSERSTFKNELNKLTKSKKKVWVVDLTSSTSKEQDQVYLRWKINKNATLLVTRVSGIKQQEGGQNMNPHGLIHWAHKSNKAEGHKPVQGFFGDLQKRFPRSRISNQIRRYFKENLKSYSWKRIGIEKGKVTPLTSSSSSSDDGGYSSGDEKKDPTDKKREPKGDKKEGKKDLKDSKEPKKEPKDRKTDGETGTKKTAIWYNDPIGDVALNPAAIPLFKTAYLEDVATSKAYLTEAEGYTLARHLGICLTILEGEVNPKEYHVIQNSGRGDCLIHTLDTANSILKSGVNPETVKRHDSAKTKELREAIAGNIDPASLVALIAAAVFGNEPGLGPNMSDLVRNAHASRKDFKEKKAKGKSTKKPSIGGGDGGQAVWMLKLGDGTADTRLFANHVGIHWQLVVKKTNYTKELQLAIQKKLGDEHAIKKHLFEYALEKSSSLEEAVFLYTDIYRSM